MGTCPGMVQASDVALPSRAPAQPRRLQVVEPGLLAAPWPASPPPQFPPGCRNPLSPSHHIPRVPEDEGANTLGEVPGNSWPAWDLHPLPWRLVWEG